MTDEPGRAESTGPDRVCVLADEYLYEWQAEALERLVRETDVEIPLVVVNAPPADAGPDRDTLGRRSLDNPRGLGLHDLALFLDMLLSEGPWALVLAERKLAWLLGWSDPHWERRRAVADVACLADSRVVRCEPVPAGGAWNRLPDHIVDLVVAESDVVVRFGFGLLKGRIIDEPAHGVLSFHPADIRRYRGLGPSQIFLNRHQRAGATLQRLSETIDGGEVVLIDTVDISDAATLDEVEERIDELQASMLAAGIERLRDPSFSPAAPDRLGEYVPLARRRELSYSLRLLAMNLAGRLRQRAGR